MAFLKASTPPKSLKRRPCREGSALESASQPAGTPGSYVAGLTSGQAPTEPILRRVAANRSAMLLLHYLVAAPREHHQVAAARAAACLERGRSLLSNQSKASPHNKRQGRRWPGEAPVKPWSPADVLPEPRCSSAGFSSLQPPNPTGCFFRAPLHTTTG